METSVVYVGMDVHKESITMAMLIGESSDVMVEKIANSDDKIRRFFKKASRHGSVKACYEASSCGYVLWRKLDRWGYHCDVIAPSTVPKSPGDKIKTDKRDAIALAKLYRADMLSCVSIPTPERERDRALVRLHDQKSADVKRNKQRILKFLQARGFVYEGKNFSRSHRAWLKSLPLLKQDRFVLDEYLATLEYEESRLAEVDRNIALLAGKDEYKEKVERLKSLKGIDTHSAMVLTVEIGDIERFESARELMAYAGLVTSEDSSGQKRRQGKTGYTGNRQIRFILVEAAWHYRHRPSVGKSLMKRQEGQPAEVVAYSMKAQQRLYKKYWKLSSVKSSQVAAVAVARELSGFIWGIMSGNVN